MFKTLRIKIVAAIMSILFAVFAGTLVVIYIVSYQDVLKENLRLMAEYGSEYEKEHIGEHNEEDGPVTSPNSDHPIHQDIFNLTTFYSVELSDDGSIRNFENEDSSGLSDEALQTLAVEAADAGKRSGSEDHLIYLVVNTVRGKLVVFMNNTIADESFTTFFRYTLIFGCCTMFVLLLFSFYLSGRIIRPLEKSFNQQKQFVSDASHELKTPLSVVSASADLLSREVGENKWLASIQSENERMSVLVNQLLQLTRTENSNTVFRDFDLSRVVKGRTLPFESLAFEGNLNLELNISDGVTVWGCEEQLGQVVSILLDNAVYHTSPGGTIKVALNKNSSTAIIKVLNTGKEIPVEKREIIFERFARLDESRNRESNHYGLGLSIAKAIVTAHKGKIIVDCSDGWTIFTVSLAARNQ